MDCYIGAATGALKGLSLKDQAMSNLVAVKGLDPKKDEVTAMVWGMADQTEILAATMNRKLRIFDTNTNSYSELFTVEGGEGAVRGLAVAGDERIVTGTESGAVRVWDKTGTELAAFEAQPNKQQFDNVNTTAMMACLRGDGGVRVAGGGRECELRMWDVSKGEQVWMARNVPNDFLDLRVPIFITDLRFLPDASQTLVSVTGHHQVRIYDPRTGQRRPVRDGEWLEDPITAMSLCNREQNIIIGNTKGEMALFDLRKMRMVHKFRGVAGAIRSIDAHPTEGYVSSCGLDRFALVHDVDSKKIISKIYCKARLNRILMRDDISLLNKVKKEELEEEEENWKSMKKSGDGVEDGSEGEEEDGSDGEEVWAELEQIDEAKSKKRKMGGEVEEVEMINDSPMTKKAKKSAHIVEICEVKEEVDCDGEELPVIQATRTEKAGKGKRLIKKARKTVK